jgi:hypothetical protein
VLDPVFAHNSFNYTHLKKMPFLEETIEYAVATILPVRESAGLDPHDD